MKVEQLRLNDSTFDSAAVAHNIYHILRERLRLILLPTALIAALGIGYAVLAPRLYDATTTVQVNQVAGNLMEIKNSQTLDLSKEDLPATIRQKLTSMVVLRRVVNRLHLTPDMLDLEKKPPGYYSLDAMAYYLGRYHVIVTSQVNTRLIYVTGESRDPKLAQKISEAVVAEYIIQHLEEEAGVSSSAMPILKTQTDLLAAKLEKSEQALQDYKEQHGAVSLETNQNITVGKLTDMNAKVTETAMERLRLEADYALIQQLGIHDPDKLLAIKSVSSSPDVLDQKQNLANKEAELANLTKRYGPLHPKYIQTESELRELKAGLNRTVLKVAAGLGNAYQSALETERKFKQALADQEKRALALNKTAISYNVLQREMESDKALYDKALTRLKEMDATKDSAAEEIRVVDPAIMPGGPAKPRVKLIIALSLVGGSTVGIALGLISGLLDSSVKTVDEAEAVLELPCVGAIPKAGPADRHSLVPIAAARRNSDVAEAFRTLRTELSSVHGNQRRPILLLPSSAPHEEKTLSTANYAVSPAYQGTVPTTLSSANGIQRHSTLLLASAAPREGKTFCATNYAVSLAHQGLRVLLIDADLRLPSIGKTFGIEAKAPGVSDCIKGNVRLGTVLRETKIEGLFVLPAGRRVNNPTELLSEAGVGDLLREAESSFDRVVIDSAPIHAVSDSLLLARHVSLVCLVVRASKTPRRAVLRAIQKLAETNSTPTGFILNYLPRFGTYYYRYGGEEYGSEAYSANGTATT